MMIIRLSGGLGNQLFQWAFGQGLGASLNAEIKYDPTDLSTDQLRNFELHQIIDSIEIASDEEIKTNRRESNQFELFRRKINTIFSPYFRRNIICEQTYLFDENLLKKANRNAYFEGYWQNEKYFNFIRGKILEQITFPQSNNPAFQELKTKFSNENITSIHVRRGDYAKNPRLLNIHGLCSAEYYQKAISLIKSKSPETTFFVFSDDIEWCKKNLSDSVNLNFVDSTSSMFEDFELLSLSTHNITANSSFSWWGAWLNENPDKLIVSPKDWFQNTQIDFSELVPQNWIKI